MILFTASGALAKSFSKQFDCKIISARNMIDQELCENIKNAAVIIHNAALISSDDLIKLVDDNFILTKKIVDMVREFNPDVRLLNISSMSFLKNENSYLDTQLMSNYAFSKFLAESYCLKQSLNICNVRFSTIFYANHNRDGLSNLAYEAVSKKEITIYNNGEAKRDFIPIDVATQYLFKLTNIYTLPKTINIVSGNSIDFKFFVKKIIELNKKVKINNIISETPEILHTFSNIGVKNLGEIDFCIEKLFEEYIINVDEGFDI